MENFPGLWEPVSMFDQNLLSAVFRKSQLALVLQLAKIHSPKYEKTHEKVLMHPFF